MTMTALLTRRCPTFKTVDNSQRRLSPRSAVRHEFTGFPSRENQENPVIVIVRKSDQAFPVMEPGAVVLLVEDDLSDVLLFDRALKRANMNFRLQIARNGQEAIDYLSGAGAFADRTQFPFPKLIVTDNRMPLVTGVEFLKWFRANPGCGIVPTIVFGGSAAPEDITRAYELGVHSYIVKPQKSEDLMNAIKLIFDYWSICQIPRRTGEASGPPP
jgi:CheY-like chemotaxis protein